MAILFGRVINCMSKIALLGDIHEKPGVVAQLLNKQYELQFSQLIQLGDFGFDHDYAEIYNHPQCHLLKILPGNHDEYPAFAKYPGLFLNDFGTLCDNQIFYVRGAYSIDSDKRLSGFNLFHQEELSLQQMYACVDYYEKVCKDVKVFLSHAAPTVAAGQIIHATDNTFIGSDTESLLQTLFQIHAPSQWFFGHYHMSWQWSWNDTQFRCLDINECCVVDI